MLNFTLLSLLIPACGGVFAETADESSLTFEKDVRPIFKAMCFHCHGEDKVTEGGLDLRLVRLMHTGGESGPAIVPGSPSASLLWRRVDSDEMPDSEKKLSPEEKEVLRRWIAQGAKTARVEPEDPEEARFTEEELGHWAFQPVQGQTVPYHKLRQEGAWEAVKHPIDAFVLEKLHEVGFQFSRRASRATYLRRMAFDLLGLPPTPEAVEAYQNDDSLEADARQVDRWLASPRFGIRWGRHWLDAAGYSETEGGNGDNDPKRPHAWRYRDYVIDAINRDKPVDVFLQEQLAGDEWLEGERDPHSERQRELLTATGFLRMAPDPSASENTLMERNAAVANALQVVSSSVLGLTIGCAQCHDHKYDPIGIDDYYRFRAIFDPAFRLDQWQIPSARLIDMTSPDVRAEADRIETEAKALEEDLKVRKRALAAQIQEKKLADVPDDDRDPTRVAVKTPRGERTPQQRELLDLYPMVKPLDTIIGLLIEYDGPAYRAFEKEQAEIAALRATKPPLHLIRATTELPGEPPVSHVFFRGDPQSPQDAVEPAEILALKRPISLPLNDPNRPTSGRRLAYARQLTDGTHPTTARVFVNRLWMHHFGKGLVETPGDFGIAGEPPSHPELLDWLAQELVQHGWSPKRLHRSMLLSTTYQQVSTRTPALDRVDPGNQLLGRANLRRLEAEALRDALLAVSGHLDSRMGGASVPVTENGEGKAVVGVQRIRDGLAVGVDDQQIDAQRPSVYVEVQRRLPLDMLATFDQPVMMPSCDARRHTTVAIQALWFLNDETLQRQAQVLAKRFMALSLQPEEQIHRLFVSLFAAPPSIPERDQALAFLKGQEAHFRESEKEAEKVAQRALASLCQVLLASNRFLYVD